MSREREKKLEREFNELVSASIERGPSMFCFDCEKDVPIRKFKKDHFIQNWGELICEDCQ